MATKEYTVRIGQEEIGHILNLKENLDYHGQLWENLTRYQALGWKVAAISAQGGVDLGLDLEQPQEQWWKQLADSGLEGVQLNLAIRTGRGSRLLVLEVNKGEGALSLDLLGDWRAHCVAELGNCREQHYYGLPPGRQPPASHFLAREVMIYGEGGLIMAPPSIEPEAREPWRWLKPPWESPPQAPPGAVWRFIREQTAAACPWEGEVPDWDEIYRAIASYEAVLKALLVPPTTIEQYYRDILRAALAVGLRDRRVLLGLLWHAPHGDGRSPAERWQYLQGLMEGETPAAAEVPHVPGPWTGGGASPGGSWLGGLVGPGAKESLELALGAGEQMSGPATGKFNQSVSKQFFQLLAGLGEKVIMESCRYEALLSGLGARAGDLDRLVAEWEQYFTGAEGAVDPKVAQIPASETGPVEYPWSKAINLQSHNNQKFQEVQTAVQDFLSKNPDLAGDRSKVQMVLFCLRNYVSINPEFAALPFRDKLDKAGQMARGFLAQAASFQ